jgi:hypothetical protein
VNECVRIMTFVSEMAKQVIHMLKVLFMGLCKLGFIMDKYDFES